MWIQSMQQTLIGYTQLGQLLWCIGVLNMHHIPHVVHIMSQAPESLRSRNNSPNNLSLTPGGHGIMACSRTHSAWRRGLRVLLEVTKHSFANKVSADLGRVDVSGRVFEVRLSKVTPKAIGVRKHSEMIICLNKCDHPISPYLITI